MSFRKYEMILIKIEALLNQKENRQMILIIQITQ